MKFKNIHTGEEIRIEHPFLLVLLFGSLYFAYKGCFGAAVVSFIIAAMTAGLSWFIFPFFGSSIIRRDYEKRGYYKI